MNRYHSGKAVPITNSFPEEKLNDVNNNIRVEKIVKSPFIFVARINNFLFFL